MMGGRGVHASHRRQLLALARKYRRDGYAVVIPDRTTELPGFLGDLMPDLIATSDNDNVVVEIKRAASLPGSNELVDLARRVQDNPGWRFELIALEGLKHIGRMSPAAVENSRSEVSALMAAGFANAAFICAMAATESLIASIAICNNINPASATFAKLTRNLVTRGLLSNENWLAITQAVEARDRRVHDASSRAAATSEIEAVLLLNDALVGELQNEKAAAA